MRPRKNIATMPVGERVAFANAVLALHAKPSQRGLNNRYDDFAKIHVDAMNVSPSWGHGGPAFTAWHRVLLAKFEQELRLIDDTVRIPFWDWTVDRTPTSPPWFSDFLGGDGGPTSPAGSESGEVTNGPFRHSAGNWNISTGGTVNDDPLNRQYLARGFARRADASALPTTTTQNTALGRTFYSNFVFDLEVPLHNLVHRWVNGQMLLRASPHDPVFWLHHCNIDRLWAVWMRGKAPADRYTAASTDPSFHQPTGNMIFHQGGTAPWSGTYRPVDVIGDHPFDVWYEGDPPIVSLETPSVSFIDVEEGRVTYAAIVFRVEAVDTIGFELLSAVPAPFGLPSTLHPPAPVPPGDSAQTARVWLSFTAPPGSVAPITVSVRCIQTGEIWNVPVTANVVPQRTAAVAFVADRSGSMAQDAGNGLTKRAKLGQALGVVAGLARDVDQLSLVQFDDQHGVLVPIGVALAGGAGGTRDALAAKAVGPNLDPRGLTGIGGGILDGVGQLASATADTVALVVITDGVENVPPTIADVAGSINSHTYAIGIGRPVDVNVNALAAICQGTDGYLLVTGDLAGQELFRLHKYFLQVHSGVVNSQIVTDPAGELTVGVEHRIPFVLTAADLNANVALISPLPEVITITLESPDGSTITAGRRLPTVQPLRGHWLGGLRLTLPALPGVDHAGKWTAVLAIDRRRLGKVLEGKFEDGSVDVDAIRQRGAVPYSLTVSARSDLELRVRTKPDGKLTDLIALLDAHGVSFYGAARATAVVTDPFGRQRQVQLDDQRNGRFHTQLVTADAGLYTVRVIVEGVLDGQSFTREQTLTIATVSGRPSENPEPDKQPRKPRIPAQKRRFTIEAALKVARQPLPLPPPEKIDPAALAMHRHGHAGSSHFPSEHELPPPVRWETATRRPMAHKSAARRPTKKQPGKKSGKRPARGGGHGH
jgi:hypothetical protein